MARKPNYTTDSAPKAQKELVAAEAHAATVEFDESDFASDSEGLTARNIVVPRLVVLQGLSPQLDAHEAEYIRDAKLGQFCDVALSETWDELLILPCHYADIYLEWAPRESGEGLIHNYGMDSKVFDSIQPDERQRRFLPNGNQVIETGTIFCLNLNAGARPSFFPLSSTLYQSAKQFNTARAEDKIPDRDGIMRQLKMTNRLWTVTTAQRQNKKGKWLIPVFRKAEFTKQFDPSGRLLEAANKFAQQCKDGLVKAEFVRDGEENIDNARM